METAVRSAWVESATITHLSKAPLLPRHGGRAQCGKASPTAGPNVGRQERNFSMRRQSRQTRRQRQQTPAETIKGRTDSGNPGINGLFEPDGKTPGSAGLGGGGCSRVKPVSKNITGNFLKISGQNRLLARRKGPPVRNSTAFADSCSSARHFPVILQNRQFKRKNRP
jgi:hypothetical protein